MPSSTVELTLPGSPASVPQARRFVVDTLEEWGLHDAAWAAQLCVSELVTNAALHAKTTFTISLTPDVDGAIRIEVTDGSRQSPRMRQDDGQATTGRGLRILDELALSWGVEAAADGKVVWVLLATHPTSSTGDKDEVGKTAEVEVVTGGHDDGALDEPHVLLRWAA